MGLLLVYGLNTWLPQLMASAGYSLNAGLALLLVLNVGAVVGLLIAGVLADRHGTKRIVLLWFGLSAVFLAALSIQIQNEVRALRRRLRHRRVRLQLPGPGLRLGQPALPGPPARHRPGLRRGRGQAGSHPRPGRHRHAGRRRHRLPVGLLRLRRRSGPGGARPRLRAADH